MSTESFADLGVSNTVISSLSRDGITDPFAIQKVVIGDAIAGRDVIVKSPDRVGQDPGLRNPACRAHQRHRPASLGPCAGADARAGHPDRR